MTPWERYAALIARHPELVQSPSDGTSLRIIVDPRIVAAEQARLRQEGQAPEWTEFGVLSEDPWLYVVRDLVEFPDGRRNGYTRVINRKTLEGGAGGVCILPVSAGNIVLLKSYRHAPRQYLWELPRGFGEPGASPEENVRRELKEEIGADVIRVVPLGLGLPDSALLRGQAHFFWAEITEPSTWSGDEGTSDGIVERRLIAPAELERMILSGEVIDVFTITAFGLARLRGLLP